MHPFFERNRFQAEAESTLENDAQLALHLILFLRTSQNNETGTWPGLHLNAILRNSCHVLEALHLLGWETATGIVETGIAWLINLPDIQGMASEDEESIRLYPSRFKTLAWLGKFQNAQLKKDFSRLEQYLDQDGLLRGIMANQLLATMIYVDCLDHLAHTNSLPPHAAANQERSLDYIEQRLKYWHQAPAYAQLSAGDLSYGLDLLCRANRLSPADSLSQAVMAVLIEALAQPETMYPIPSDTLYCGIQLATYFPEQPAVARAVHNLVAHLRTRYEQLELKKEAIFFHPLVLRLLWAWHGPHLKTEMTKILLEHEQQHLELRRHDAEQARKDHFRDLLKRRFEVEISEVRPLTGGITQAEVFRVHFSFKLSSIKEGREVHVNTYYPNPGSLVIKSGSMDSLQQAIHRYRNLPASLKDYFAKYEGDPQILGTAPTAPCYLIMEDLTYMNTFQDILAEIDQGHLARAQRHRLAGACQAICDNLFAIYDQTRRGETDFFGPQLSRLYTSDMEKHLIQMCRPDKFSHLKSWLRGFWLGERRYLSIEHYLRKIESHKSKLKIPYLTLIHGDCHSRNLMLSEDLSRVKLIDLDKLDEDGDYIKDLALLIEDIAIFRFLFDEDYRFYLGKGATRLVSEFTEPRLAENRIEYPPFSSEAVRLCQQHLLSHLADYARDIKDETWKERLWLALAAFLLLLVTKHPDKGAATVIYVEAVKLLDQLVAWLDEGRPLAPIPFPDEHPAGVTPDPHQDSPSLPTWYGVNRPLTTLHSRLVAFDPAVKYEVVSNGQVAQYFSSRSQALFAIIDGKKEPPSILLACGPEALADPGHLVQARQTESPFQSMIIFDSHIPADPLLPLLQQAFELNH